MDQLKQFIRPSIAKIAITVVLFILFKMPFIFSMSFFFWFLVGATMVLFRGLLPVCDFGSASTTGGCNVVVGLSYFIGFVYLYLFTCVGLFVSKKAGQRPEKKSARTMGWGSAASNRVKEFIRPTKGKVILTVAVVLISDLTRYIVNVYWEPNWLSNGLFMAIRYFELPVLTLVRNTIGHIVPPDLDDFNLVHYLFFFGSYSVLNLVYIYLISCIALSVFKKMWHGLRRKAGSESQEALS